MLENLPMASNPKCVNHVIPGDSYVINLSSELPTLVPQISGNPMFKSRNSKYTLTRGLDDYFTGLYKAYKFTSLFDDVGGLQTGNNVWLSGVKIGTVSSLSFYGKKQVREQSVNY